MLTFRFKKNYQKFFAKICEKENAEKFIKLYNQAAEKWHISDKITSIPNLKRRINNFNYSLSAVNWGKDCVIIQFCRIIVLYDCAANKILDLREKLPKQISEMLLKDGSLPMLGLDDNNLVIKDTKYASSNSNNSIPLTKMHVITKNFNGYNLAEKEFKTIDFYGPFNISENKFYCLKRAESLPPLFLKSNSALCIFNKHGGVTKEIKLIKELRSNSSQHTYKLKEINCVMPTDDSFCGFFLKTFKNQNFQYTYGNTSNYPQPMRGKFVLFDKTGRNVLSKSSMFKLLFPTESQLALDCKALKLSKKILIIEEEVDLAKPGIKISVYEYAKKKNNIKTIHAESFSMQDADVAKPCKFNCSVKEYSKTKIALIKFKPNGELNSISLFKIQKNAVPEEFVKDLSILESDINIIMMKDQFFSFNMSKRSQDKVFSDTEIVCKTAQKYKF